MKTRAALFHTSHVPFTIQTLDLEAPRSDEVLVKVGAAGVCHSDWHLMTGATSYPTPVVPGHEGAGTVQAVGPGVTRVQPGDRVVFNWVPNCGLCFYCLRNLPSLCARYTEANWNGTMLDGTTRLSLNGEPVYHFSTIACFAEYAVVPEQCCVPLKQDVPVAVAALIGCAVTTGVGAVLNKAKVTPGSSVAVFGAGGIGLSIILGARLAGASSIIAVDLSEAKGDLARSFGATISLVAGPTVNDEIRRLTEGRGVDYAFEAAGIPVVQEACLDAVRPGGTVVLVGISPVGSSTNLPGALITRQEKTVMGTYYGTTNPARDFPLYADLYLGGKLDLERLVTKTYPLDAINEAYADMIGGRGGRGVIVF